MGRRKLKIEQREQRRIDLENQQKLGPPVILTWDRSKAAYPPGYYTYRLLDPRTGLAFYVGKGQRSRAWQHEALVAAGDLSGNARKVQRIVEILGAGLEIEIEIVACYKFESDALEHEYRLVDADATLTNIMPGGCGKAETPEHKRRRARIRFEKLRRLRLKEREAHIAAELEANKARFLAYARTEPQQAEISAWLSRFDGKNRHLDLRLSAVAKAAHQLRK